MFSTPTTSKIPKNNDITCAPPDGYHYWGTEPKLLPDGKPTIMPLRPNSEEHKNTLIFFAKLVTLK
jgi:hypothetical protein